MLLYLEEKIIRTKNPSIILDTLYDIAVVLTRDDMLGYLSIHRSREDDQITMELPEELEVDPDTPVIVSLQLRERDELDEVLVTRIVLRKQYNLIDFIVLISIGSSLLRYLELDSDDRLDSVLHTRLIELEGTIHIAHISDRDGTLTEFLRPLGETLRITESLLESIVSMVVEVDE
jgi:hypothetical protein